MKFANIAQLHDLDRTCVQRGESAAQWRHRANRIEMRLYCGTVSAQNVILQKIENFITFKPFDRYAPNLIGVIPVGRAIVCDRSPMGEGRGGI